MNNTMPFFIPGLFNPQPFPNNNDINIEKRISDIEKDIKNLIQRINNLEKKYSNTSYQTNSYNMM